MSVLDAVFMVLAGVAAGSINAIVGSGSLVTFPTLLLLGIPPIPANISNSLAMLGGGVTAIVGYRRELSGGWPFLRTLVPISVVGALAGALLLLVLPASAFKAIVPVLIAFGLVLVIVGPRLQRAAAAGHATAGTTSVLPPAGHGAGWRRWVLTVGVLLAAAYGGYFGAAQGVILMGLLSAFAVGDLQTLNGYKNVLAFVANGVAGLVFIVVAWDKILWHVVVLVGVGALVGGWVGASLGRRLPAPVLRATIVVIGIVGIVKVVWFP